MLTNKWGHFCFPSAPAVEVAAGVKSGQNSNQDLKRGPEQQQQRAQANYRRSLVDDVITTQWEIRIWQPTSTLDRPMS